MLKYLVTATTIVLCACASTDPNEPAPMFRETVYLVGDRAGEAKPTMPGDRQAIDAPTTLPLKWFFGGH